MKIIYKYIYPPYVHIDIHMYIHMYTVHIILDLHQLYVIESLKLETLAYQMNNK